MKITASTTPLNKQKKEALLVLVQKDEILLPASNKSLKKTISDQIKQAAFSGQVGETVLLPAPKSYAVSHLILAGLGDLTDFHSTYLEQAAAAAVRAGRAAHLKSFVVSSDIQVADLSSEEIQLLLGRGASWGTYESTQFKSEQKKVSASSLTFVGKKTHRAIIKRAEAQGRALIETADLANAPGNTATPTAIANWAKKMAKENNLSCTVLGEKELKKRGCGGILAVGQGSAEESKMILLEYAGTNPKAKPIVLVGKTVTFDSGGISLKPGKGMGWMRYDKSGGMAVLAAMQMVAQAKPESPVIGILGAAENMPGANAIRPGDIIKTYAGKTIEVLNTDAEGRLVLVDALALAVERNPAAIVDLATLTGAVIMALGNTSAAILGNNDTFVQTLIQSANDAGERLWQLPLYKEYADQMKSDFADLSNISKVPGAGTATAAAFLREFVPSTIPWAHIDIAGTAWLESAKPYQSAGATLFGARLLVHWILSKG